MFAVHTTNHGRVLHYSGFSLKLSVLFSPNIADQHALMW